MKNFLISLVIPIFVALLLLSSCSKKQLAGKENPSNVKGEQTTTVSTPAKSTKNDAANMESVELLIQVESGYTIEQICEQHPSFDLVIDREVSKIMRAWLVTIGNSKKADEHASLLEALKTTSGVTNAQYNKKVTTRP